MAYFAVELFDETVDHADFRQASSNPQGVALYLFHEAFPVLILGFSTCGFGNRHANGFFIPVAAILTINLRE